MTDSILRRHFLQGAAASTASPMGSQGRASFTSQGSLGGMAWRGVWHKASNYRQGDIVSHGGIIWIAAQQSLNRPPVDDESWDIFLASPALRSTLHAVTRGALKGLDPTKNTTGILIELGREGIFIWRSGNYSAQVSADPFEGVFIEADSVAASDGAWVRVYDELDVCWFGAAGEGSDATSAFAAAISLSHFLGLNRIVCKDAAKQFKIAQLHITADIEMNLGGATILGDFGPWGTHSKNGTPIYWTKNIFYSVAANAPSVKLKHMTLDGQSDAAFQMIGGVPMIDFRGGLSPGRCVVEFDRVTVTRGSNRAYTAGSGVENPTLLLSAANMEILVYNADELWISNMEIRSCPGEMIQVQSDDSRTKVRIDRLYATKARDGDFSSKWSNSALNVVNCHPTSAVRNSRFYDFVKSAINWESTGGLIETCEFENVIDSNALDFNEASSYRFNQLVVRNCFFKNVSRVGIRASSSNTLFENNTFENVNICISFEGNVVGDAERGSWLNTNDVILVNNTVRHCWMKSFDADHPDRIGVRILGKDADNPAVVTIDGGDIVDQQPTAANARYGVYASNARLRLSGYFGDGNIALIYLSGAVVLRGRDMIVSPQSGGAAHIFQLRSVTLRKKALVLDNIIRQATLDAGIYDFLVDSSTVDADAINIDGSPDFAGTSNGSLAIARNGKLAGTAARGQLRIAAGGSVKATVVVIGAQLGDLAEALINSNQNGLIITAYVSSSDAVTVIYFNPSGFAVDVSAHTLTVWITKATDSRPYP